MDDEKKGNMDLCNHHPSNIARGTQSPCRQALPFTTRNQSRKENMLENEQKMWGKKVKIGEKKWVKMGEKPNMPYPMRKKHKKTNNNDTPRITKNGFLVRPHAQVVALCAHCARGAPYVLGSVRGMWGVECACRGGAAVGDWNVCLLCSKMQLLALVMSPALSSVMPPTQSITRGRAYGTNPPSNSVRCAGALVVIGVIHIASTFEHNSHELEYDDQFTHRHRGRPQQTYWGGTLPPHWYPFPPPKDPRWDATPPMRKQDIVRCLILADFCQDMSAHTPPPHGERFPHATRKG